MLEGLNIGGKYGTGGFTGLNTNYLLDQKGFKEQPTTQPIKDQANVGNNVNLNPNISNFSQNGADSLYGAGSGHFSTTENYLDRQIEDMKKKEGLPTVDNSKGFGNFEITKPEPKTEQLASQDLPVKMSIAEFGQTIKKKYPEYEDLEDEDIGQRVLAKYPEYNDMIQTVEPKTRKFLSDKIYEAGQRRDNAVARGLTNTVGFGTSILEKLIYGPAGLIEKAGEYVGEKIVGTKLGDAIEKGAEGLFGKEVLEEYQSLPEEEKRTFNTTVSQDILNMGEGALHLAFAYLAPIMTVGFNIGGEVKEFKPALEGLGNLVNFIGRKANDYLPGLNDFRTSLPDQDQREFDQFVGDILLVAIGGAKGKKNIIKDPKKFIVDNINPANTIKQFQTNVLKAPMQGIEGIGKAIGKVGEGVGKSIESFKENIKGLSKQQQKAIENNPYVKEMGAEVLKNVEEGTAPHNLNEVREPYLKKLVDEIDTVLEEKKNVVSENGEGYNTLRKDTTKYDTKPLINEIDKILDGTTYTAESFLKMVDEGNLLGTWNILNGDGTIAQLHDVRKGIDALLKKSSFEKNQGRVNMLTKMRKLVDNKLKENPNWKALDENYSKIRSEISEIEEGITYREKRRQGQFKDNVDNIIANINNPAKANLKARLAEYFPDLSERVAAIQMLPDIVKSYTKVPKSRAGQILTTGLGGMIGGGIGGLPGAVLGSLVGGFTDLVLTQARKSAIKKAVKNMSSEAKAKLDVINKKINQKQVLDAKQVKTVKDLVNKIKKEAGLDAEFNNKLNESISKIEKGSATDTLNSLNPTHSIFAEYQPNARATIPLGKNMTTLAETLKKSPNETITIYRGVSAEGGTIVPGDYITTNPKLAQDYAGNGKVISKKVRLGDILDDITEPLGEEYIYRPENNKVGTEAKGLSNLGKTEAKLEKAKYVKVKDVKVKNEGLNKLGDFKKPETAGLSKSAKLSYDKSNTANKVNLEVYKGIGVNNKINTPGVGKNYSFYTNEIGRAKSYSPDGKIIKENIKLDSKDVKIINSEGISFSSKVDKNGNIINSKDKISSSNFLNYNNDLAKKQGYKAVIYKNIIDNGGFARPSQLPKTADDIVLLDKGLSNLGDTPINKISKIKSDVGIKGIEKTYKEILPFLENENKLFSDKIKTINKDVGGVGAALGPIKKPDSIYNKMLRKGYSMDKVNDFVRGTVKYTDESSINRIKKQFEKFDGFEDRTTPEAIKKNMGYKDYQVVYKLKSGIMGELQFNTPDMLFAKDGVKAVEYGLLTKNEYTNLVKKYGEAGGEGHKYYDERKKINEKRKNGIISIKEFENLTKPIIEESMKYYKKFY